MAYETPIACQENNWLSAKKLWNFCLILENNYKSQIHWEMKPPMSENIGCPEKSKLFFFLIWKYFQVPEQVATPIAYRENIGCQEKSEIFFFNFEKNY